MKNLKAIIFDLDGTLINTPEMIMDAFKKTIFDHHPNYELSNEQKTNVLGQTLDKAFKDFVTEEIEIEEMIDSYRHYTTNHDFEIKGYKHLEHVLKELKELGYLVGIVTSKTDYVAHQNLKDLNIEQYFDCVVTHQDTNLHKPNPEPILFALDKLGVNPNEAIYIGDHENDIVAGRNALVKTGLMAYSHRLNEAEIESPNYIFKDLKDILKRIERE